MYRFHFTREELGLTANVRWHPEDGVLSVVKVKDDMDKGGIEIPLSAFSADELDVIDQECRNAAIETDRLWREAC